MNPLLQNLKKELPVVLVPVKVEVSAQKICDQLCAAFEGGSNYWLRAAALIDSLVPPKKGNIWYGQEKIYTPGFRCELGYDDPEGPGETVKIITWDDLAKGLQIMAEKYPRHFADVIDETGDAITGDVYIQCVIFGEIVYG